MAWPLPVFIQDEQNTYTSPMNFNMICVLLRRPFITSVQVQLDGYHTPTPIQLLYLFL